MNGGWAAAGRGTVATAVVLALAAVSVAFPAPGRAAVPRSIARAFLDAGVPMTAVGIVVQDAAAPRPLFAHQPELPLNPASVMKLVTTFAALELLGTDYRWRTEAYLDGPLEHGVLRGNLVLKGYGDPKITVEQWQSFMADLRARGIDEITGDLVLDRSFFALPPHDAAGFDNEPLKPYNVGPDALLVNFKAVRFAFAPAVAGDAVALAVEPALGRVAVHGQLRAAASATGGLPCSTTRRTCTRCSRPTSAPPAAGSGVVGATASRPPGRRRSRRCARRRSTTSSATSTSCRTT